MRFLSIITLAILFVGVATVAAAADEEHPLPQKARTQRHARPPAEANEPEKKDWISQTVGDVLDGVSDLGKPLQDLQR